ncbi:MerR family transcriptional regulator [Streptomyces sp. NPDC056049]|uniref:MerR family transcriptional regulator n=1 Tax=Streptomyces sp. NPDC056049 TaxID=3345693 RepID=UPI0035DD6E4E
MDFPLAMPRQVKIGGAAVFAGTTPRAIRHYHAIGLLPEPERGGDGKRRYGYDDMIRLLWIRKMADAGISLEDMRTAFDGTRTIDKTLERLEETLAAQEAALQRRRGALHRLREAGSPLGLLSSLVADRLRELPEGTLRPTDLDNLLVAERIFGPLGSALQASVCIVLAGDAELRAEADRLDAGEAALDDSVDPHDPRVEEIAVQRCAFQQALDQAIDAAGLEEAEGELFDLYDADLKGEENSSMSVLEVAGKMPYDFSPARLRCMELAIALYVQDH